MRSRLFMVFVVAVGALMSIPAVAHHGGASILSGQAITLKGTVKAWLWSNPHCLLTFEVKGEDGKVVQWVAETQAPSSIYSSGYRKDSFKPGDRVTITLDPVKSGAPNGRIARAVLADGTTLGGQAGGAGGDGARGGRGAADTY